MIKFEGWVLISLGGAFILSALHLKGNLNNYILIDKYKLTKFFHTKKMQKINIVFSALVVKACMYVMEGPKSIEALQLIACLILIPIFLLT